MKIQERELRTKILLKFNKESQYLCGDFILPYGKARFILSRSFHINKKYHSDWFNCLIDDGVMVKKNRSRFIMKK